MTLLSNRCNISAGGSSNVLWKWFHKMLLEQGKVDEKQLGLNDDLCNDKISFHSFVLGALTTNKIGTPQKLCVLVEGVEGLFLKLTELHISKLFKQTERFKFVRQQF